MLLIQLFRMRTEDKKHYPSITDLCEVLWGSEESTAENLKALESKEMIRPTDFFDAEKGLVFKGYDFEPLFEKLSEFWACAKVKDNEKMIRTLEKKAGNNLEINLYNNFEKEFGRPLSPMEVDQINMWSRKIKPIMIIEALRKAVLLGKHNFKYIDGILLEWEKNSINCPEDIKEYDKQYKTKNHSKHRATTGIKDNSEKKPDESSDKQDKKNLVKSLYMN